MLRTLVILAIAFVLSLFFQNCSGNPQLLDSLYKPEAVAVKVECVESTCTQDTQGVQIGVMNEQQITVYKALPNGTKTLGFDVAGYCDTSGFTKSRFYYRIVGPTGTSSDGSYIDTGVSCNSVGRFRILVSLPTNFDYVNVHTLNVVMKVIDEQNQYLDNPVRLNYQDLMIVPNIGF